MEPNEKIWNRWLTFGVLLLTFFAAFFIGITQNDINKDIKNIYSKLENTENYVEIFAYADPPESQRLKLINVSNVQLYITKYTIDNKSTLVENALLPGKQALAWWIIILPPTEINQQRKIVVNLIDQNGKSWESNIDAYYIADIHGLKGWEITTHKIIQK